MSTPDVARRKSEAVDRLFEQPNTKIEPLSDRLLRQLRKEQARPPEAVPVPLPKWARMTGGPGGGRGIGKGMVVVVAGPSGAGKTLLSLMQIAEALATGVNVLLFSLEMSWKANATRLRSIVTGAKAKEVDWGDRFNADTAEYADAAILNLPGTLYLNTEPLWKLEDVRECIAAHADGADVELVVVDYMQLLDPGGSDRALFEQMTAISRQLGYMADKANVACLAVSQLNSSATADPNASPRIDQLYGSRRITHDADQVLLIDPTTYQVGASPAVLHFDLLLAKNRWGPEGPIPCKLDKRTLRITQRRVGSQEDAK